MIGGHPLSEGQITEHTVVQHMRPLVDSSQVEDQGGQAGVASLEGA